MDKTVVTPGVEMTPHQPWPSQPPAPSYPTGDTQVAWTDTTVVAPAGSFGPVASPAVPESPVRNKRRWLPAVLGSVWVVALASGGALFASQRDAAPVVVVGEAQLPVVKVATVTPLDVSRSLVFGGVVRSSVRSALSFTVPGRLVKRRVSVGDELEAGAVLAELDKKPFTNQVAAASVVARQAGVALAQQRRRNRRSEALASEAVISDRELEEAIYGTKNFTTQRQRAAIELREARRKLAEATLSTPFAGTVTEVYVEVGEYVVPGKPAFVVTGNDGVKLQVEIPEGIVGELSPGQSVDVAFPLVDEGVLVGDAGASDRHIKGRIGSITPPEPSGGRLFVVDIDLGQVTGVLPGMTAQLVLPSDVGTELAVPLEAVINDAAAEQTVVYRVVGGVIDLVPVHVVEVVGGMAAVSGNLSVGDELVLGGHAGLVAGEMVESRQ